VKRERLIHVCLAHSCLLRGGRRRVARESVSEDRQPVWERDEEVVKCFDGGCFGELPQGAVARVAAGDFDAAGAELRRLMSDAARRRELGAHAPAGERA